MKRVTYVIVAALALPLACMPTSGERIPQGFEGEYGDVATLLAQRSAEYEAVFDQARVRGFFAGALRGIVLGALIDGERGAAIGATLGAAFGSAYSATAAEQLLQEREEFLNRQLVIANILAASRGATARSTEDAELVSRAVTQYATPAATLNPETRREVARSIGTLRHAVEMRALLISELLEETTLSPEEQVEVQAEIELQRDALRVIRDHQDVWGAQING